MFRKKTSKNAEDGGVIVLRHFLCTTEIRSSNSNSIYMIPIEAGRHVE